jgi:hypothetical protein
MYVADDDEWRGKDGLFLVLHDYGVALKVPHLVRDGVHLQRVQKPRQLEP